MSIESQGHFFTIYFPGFVYLCFTRPRYQVSVYRTNGPLVFELILIKVIIFFSNYLPLQIWTLKICNHDISKTITDRSFKLGQLIEDDE